MLQVQVMTHDEKVKMYKKLSKKELIAMLIESNNHLERLTPQIFTFPTYPVTPYVTQPFFPTWQDTTTASGDN